MEREDNFYLETPRAQIDVLKMHCIEHILYSVLM